MHIIAYPIGMGSSDAKISGYRGSFVSIGKTLLNFCDLCRRKFCVMSPLSSRRNMRSNSPRMFQIICLRNPFQIADMIVQLVGILVINLRQIVWIWQKGDRNKAMNQNIPYWFGSVCQSNGGVSARINSPFKWTRAPSSFVQSKSPRANLSAFGNFVQSFVAPNWGIGFSSHALIPNSVLGYVNV